jgi:hypothetical protein
LGVIEEDTDIWSFCMGNADPVVIPSVHTENKLAYFLAVLQLKVRQGSHIGLRPSVCSTRWTSKLSLTMRKMDNQRSLCDKLCQWLAAGQWFSSDFPVSSTNKTDCQDITEKFLKVVSKG